jgi:TatA/E family protein of Tat protein translocase
MPFGIGVTELLIITFLAVLFFGTDKLTNLARDAGKSIKAFKQEVTDVEEIEEAITAPVKKAKTTKKAKAAK